ncbi:hypothetical protein CK203_030039 [Vitis vinifera]|uniref:Uncharacterized protein n=1 Tax=Vitis vinifera TaxID=29760 RepID=A0A438IK80_VITVI|nr:hypothetical protein CK203_030039 [Vitis vinifera]
MEEMSKKIVRSLGVGRYLEWRTVNSRGASSGVLVFWDNKVLQLLDVEVGIFLASCWFKNCEDDFCWIFTRVYGLTLKKERKSSGFPVECSRGGRLTCSMRRFSEIMKLELRDLPLQGGSYTWRGGLNNQPNSRLDWFLVSEDWEGRFTGGFSFSGSASFVLAAKLKVLKPLLRDWNRNVFGKVEVNKAWALNQVEFWDRVELDRLLAIHELEASKGAKEDFKKWILLEEISKRQKSREEGGDPVLVVCLFATLVAVEAARSLFLSWRSLFLSWREFHYHNCFVRSLNATFLILIPKKGGVEDLRDFRSISLVGGLYKWLAKVLANRFRGRNGLGGCGGVSPQPIFLLWLMGLPQVSSRVLGVLRQGDPLSPYLFVIVMEALSCLFQRVVNGGFLLSYKVILGLRINFDKSALIPVGCVENMEALATELGCKVGSLLSSYLGLSLGALYKFVAAWDGVEVRVWKRLARWKCQYISKEGRITLIWSTLASLPISFMSVLFLPRTVKLRVKFWKDRWCGAAPFCVSFPTLFALAVSKSAWVSMGSVQQDVEDRVLWIETKCEKFSIKSLYKALGFDSSVSFPSNVIWKTCVQPKWVLPATVKETLLSWNGSFVGK